MESLHEISTKKERPVQKAIAQKIPYASVKGMDGSDTQKGMLSALSELRDYRPDKKERDGVRNELGKEIPFSEGVSVENKDVYRRIIKNKYNVEINKDVEDFLIGYDRSFENDKSGINHKELKPEMDGSAIPTLGTELKEKVINWAEAKLDLSDIFNMNLMASGGNAQYQFSTTKDEERGFSPKAFSEVASDFNTACVVVGDKNIKKRDQKDYKPDYQVFYGQNQGYKLWKNSVNRVLDKKLTKIGFEYWEPKNCAEVDAIHKATSAGVDLEHAHMYTVGAKFDKGRYKKLVEKPACLNCTAAFGSSVRDRNYSGWDKKTLVRREDFDTMLDIEYLNKSSKDVEDIVEKEAHIDDKNKALNSYDAIHRL